VLVFPLFSYHLRDWSSFTCYACCACWRMQSRIRCKDMALLLIWSLAQFAVPITYGPLEILEGFTPYQLSPQEI